MPLPLCNTHNARTRPYTREQLAGTLTTYPWVNVRARRCIAFCNWCDEHEHEHPAPLYLSAAQSLPPLSLDDEIDAGVMLSLGTGGEGNELECVAPRCVVMLCTHTHTPPLHHRKCTALLANVPVTLFAHRVRSCSRTCISGCQSPYCPQHRPPPLHHFGVSRVALFVCVHPWAM